ncbi:MAG: cytochrome c3 family protein [Planctomycetota bacterium]|jgi:cytochrome c-type protein NapC/trimethylamine-N-oxide reductase cytochrome c-type subunit TorC
MVKFIQKLIRWIFVQFKKWALTFFAGFVFALLCFVVLNAAMEPVSKSEYCGTKCHEMDTAYQSWKLSIHGANERGLRVECIDCHLPSKDKYFTHLVAKAYTGGKDMYKHYFGGEYDIEKIREEVLAHMSNDRCLGCHVDLLTKPSSEDVREAHVESLSSPEVLENRCIECHEEIGHQR